MSAALESRAVLAVAPGPFILHIGKTGGSSVKRLVRGLDDETRASLGVGRLPRTLSHSLSRLDTWPRHRRGARFSFVFRDPAARYASGFDSRLRQGRPAMRAGARPWSTAEAAAFSWFATANDCFEALGSKDERVRSAAHFACSAISHVRNDHVHYLGDRQAWRRRAGRAYFFCPFDRLTEQIHRFFPASDRIDRAGLQARLGTRHVAPSTGAGSTSLSETATRNLRDVRPEEFALYETLAVEFSDRFT